VIERDRLAKLLERERATFRRRHPRSGAAHRAAAASLFGGVPMTWMNKAPAASPCTSPRPGAPR
jgi:glutamate-1-semialdehyde 2,1-aminomutase